MDPADFDDYDQHVEELPAVEPPEMGGWLPAAEDEFVMAGSGKLPESEEGFHF